MSRGKVGGAWDHSADHHGRPTSRWALLPPCSGRPPRVSLSIPRVPKLLVNWLGAACGPFDPCEPEFCALIGPQFF